MFASKKDELLDVSSVIMVVYYINLVPVLLTILHVVNCSHVRGGLITLKPVGNNQVYRFIQTYNTSYYIYSYWKHL